MDLTKYFIGGAAITGIIAAWGQIKAVAASIGNLFIKRENITTTELASDIIRYIRDNHKYYLLTYRNFSYIQNYMPKVGKYGRICTEVFDNTTILFFVNYKPILFITNIEETGSDKSTRKGAHFLSARGAFNVEKFISSAVNTRNDKDWHYSDQTNSRFIIKNYPNIYRGSSATIQNHANYKLWSSRLIGFEENELTFPKNIVDNIDRLVFDDSVYECIKSVELWLKYKDWYNKKGIPWKTGWLLYGQPGVGKTSAALALAQKYDLPIFIFRLGLLSSQEFTKAWREMQSNVPCIALIEDFDNVFHGRENVSGYKDYISGFGMSRITGMRKDGNVPTIPDIDENFAVETELTFDTLLNTLDGIERYEGVFTIITTNDIAQIDPALLHRPGRIDKTIELGFISKKNKIKMAENIIGEEWPEFISEFDLNEENVTPASFQEKLISITLNNLYRENING